MDDLPVKTASFQLGQNGVTSPGILVYFKPRKNVLVLSRELVYLNICFPKNEGLVLLPAKSPKQKAILESPKQNGIQCISIRELILYSLQLVFLFFSPQIFPYREIFLIVRLLVILIQRGILFLSQSLNLERKSTPVVFSLHQKASVLGGSQRV